MTDQDKEYIEHLEEVVKGSMDYFYNEMGWEWFRAEMLYGSGEGEYPAKQRASTQNAERLHAFLQACKAEDPRVADLIASAISRRK